MVELGVRPQPVEALDTPTQRPEMFGIGSQPTAIVIGGGAAGLNAAVEARRQGFLVKELITARPPHKSTAGQAGASFKPHMAIYNEATWRAFELTREEYDRITQDYPQTHHGVHMHRHWEASDEELIPKPYLPLMRDVTYHEDPDEIPGNYGHAISYDTYLIDTQAYIKWMVKKIRATGTEIVSHQVQDMEEIEKMEADVVFDCTGMGADKLGTVHGLVPVRGQTVVVSRIPDMDWSISADGFCVYNRENNALIGGTAEYGESETRTDVGTVNRLFSGNMRAVPHLKDPEIKIIKATAGIRPHHPDGGYLLRSTMANKDVVSINGLSGWGLTGGRGMAVQAVELVKR